MRDLGRIYLKSPDGSILKDWTPFDVQIDDDNPIPLPPIPPVPTPTGDDMIDFSSALMTSQSPDIRWYPKTARFSSLSLSATSHMMLDFSKKTGPDAWPKFVAKGFADPLQYTLSVGCKIHNQWYFSCVIDCIEDYIPTGPALYPNQLPQNWYYFAGAPLSLYSPSPNELVAFVVTAGVQRRDNQFVVQERSNVVLVPFAVGTYTF